MNRENVYETGEDAIEFFIVGASAIAVGTANFINPRASLDIIDDIRQYFEQHKTNSIQDLIGNFQISYSLEN